MRSIAFAVVLALPCRVTIPQQPTLAGIWSGYMGASESQRSDVIVEFKVDAKGVVTGTITGPKLASPGDITTGSFDGKTGAVAFTVIVRRDSTRVAFNGTVAGSALSGTLAMGQQKGEFKLTKGPPQATANSASPRVTGDAGVAARRGFVEVSGWITRAADMVPADKYSYRPVATVRTFGQIVGHVADAYHTYCGRAAGRNTAWGDVNEKAGGDKAKAVQALKQALAECTAAYDGASQIGPLFENVAHANLHYGNIVTYMRMLGLVPPSS